MIRIVNGKIYDPANGKNGEVGELWYNDGRIVEGGGEYETLDAEGCVVMAGGVDIHSHLAGEPLELLRDAANPIIPTVGDIGKQYAGMGYTAVVNAAVPALAARRTILEEHAIDGIDAFNLTWIGENPAFKQLIQNGSDEELDQYLAWLLDVSCGWGLKLINPNGGEEGWREMTLRLMKANERMGLPHPLHLHHPYLAKPGAYEDIIKTMDMAEGMPLHLAHLQFYSYKKNQKGRIVSSAQELAAAVNAHPNVTADVGAVIFGPAAAVSCDTAFVGSLGSGKKGAGSRLWEQDGGMAVLPLKYSSDNLMGATQFMAGLELMLCVEKPEQMLLTTDHPNGGPFSAYPYLIAMLMDKGFRDEELKKLNPKALKNSALTTIDREYTMDEIARLTRSGAAQRLGAKNIGHLGIGAEGGVTLYKEQSDKQAMFGKTYAVLRGESKVFAQAPGEYDREWVKKLIQPYIDVDFEKAGLDASFIAANRIAREVR